MDVKNQPDTARNMTEATLTENKTKAANNVIAAMLSGIATSPEAERPRGHRNTRLPFKVEAGKVWREVDRESDDEDTRKRWVPFVSELSVLALTRSAGDDDWGRLLEVVDPDDNRHRWAMPLSMLAGSGEALRAELLSRGLRPEPGASRKWKDWLMEYIFAADPEARARCVTQIGWHGAAYVLPDETIGGDGSEDILLQSERTDHALNVAGTLEDWQAGVAAPALGNSRLVLAISAGFAACLLGLTGEDGGGFHLRGGSSLGKSTALYVAASVWGGGGTGGYVRNWRATDNALEALAAQHNGALLCLDELSQVDARAAGAAAYMLANGKGKARAGKEGQARRAHEWRLLFLSTGEIALSDKIREGGGQIAAGMEVRIIDIRADAGAGLGLFEDLHGSRTAASFASELRSASERCYGTAARAFLHQVVADLPGMRDRLAALRQAFTEAVVPPDADGQVQRVANRFALVAAAGDLATLAGVTGWTPGAARQAAMQCFQDWLAERGGKGAGEVTAAKARLAEALALHGAARFQKWHRNADRLSGPRWGFCRVQTEDGDPLETYDWYLTPSALQDILRGLDLRAVVAALMAEDVIVAQGSKGHANKTYHVPSAGTKMRLYQINPAVLSGSAPSDGPDDDAA